MFGRHVDIIHVRLYLWICISEYMYLHVAMYEIDLHWNTLFWWEWKDSKNHPRYREIHFSKRYQSHLIKFSRLTPLKKTALRAVFFGGSHGNKRFAPSILFCQERCLWTTDSEARSLCIRCTELRWPGTARPEICAWAPATRDDSRTATEAPLFGCKLVLWDKLPSDVVADNSVPAISSSCASSNAEWRETVASEKAIITIF